MMMSTPPVSFGETRSLSGRLVSWLHGGKSLSSRRWGLPGEPPPATCPVPTLLCHQAPREAARCPKGPAGPELYSQASFAAARLPAARRSQDPGEGNPCIRGPAPRATSGLPLSARPPHPSACLLLAGFAPSIPGLCREEDRGRRRSG